MPRLVVRWTAGDVSPYGFEALSASVRAACARFGGEADYVICVNSVSGDEAKRRLDRLPANVIWRPMSKRHVSNWIRNFVDPALAEELAWKFAPVRIRPLRSRTAQLGSSRASARLPI